MTSDLVGVIAQRESVRSGVVVGVAIGDMPEGGLTLGIDEGNEVLHAVGGPSGVLHLPHHDGGDLDGVAVRIVDLHGRGLLIADPHRDPSADGKEVDPAQAGLPHRSPVAPEELDDAHLARLDGGETGQARRPAHEHRGCHPVLDGASGPGQQDSRGVGGQRPNQDGDAGTRPQCPFLEHDRTRRRLSAALRCRHHRLASRDMERRSNRCLYQNDITFLGSVQNPDAATST